MRKSRLLLWLLVAAVATPVFGQAIDGDLTVRYRDRWGTEDWEDEDVYAYLRFSLYDDARAKGLGGAFSLRADWDLLTSANEIDEGRDDLRVYYAYLDVNKLENVGFRAGRMVVEEAEGWHITGLRAAFQTSSRRVRFSLFGGEPVSYYRSVGDDWTAGAALTFKPDRSSSVRLSWIHVDENLTEPLDFDRDTENDVATFAYRKAWKLSNVWATVRTLNFDVWNGFVGGNYLIAPADLHLTATYRRQEETNSSFSRYYYGHLSRVLGPSLPYQMLTVALTRPFGDWFTLGGGATFRELLDDAETRTNQEFDRYYLDLFLHERMLWGFTAFVDYSHWETDRDENDTWAGSIGRAIGEHFKFDIGTLYTKYDVTYFSDLPDAPAIERYDVRTYYIRGDWRVKKKYRIQVDFEQGTDSTSDDDFYQLELRFGLDFAIFGKG